MTVLQQFLINNIFIVAVFIISGTMLLWPLIKGGMGSGRDISTLDATHLINRENALVLDVREDHEYALMHVPNSRHIPLAALESRLNELTKFKDKPIILNCQTGNRSTKACALLQKNQFSKVYVLKGGIGAWEEASLPLERSKA
jgi:rhodanese-related sulfurtransferase